MGDVEQWEYEENYMIIYVLLKFIFTILTVSMNVPSGIFTPTFVIGAVFGQLYCSLLLRTISTMGYTDIIVYRGVYSIIGAASVTASVTRTVSIAVIVLELSGHFSHVIPILIAVLTSYIISELINPEGFYDTMFKIRGLQLMLEKKGKILVQEVLEFEDRFTNIEFLSLEMDVEEIYQVLYRSLDIDSSQKISNKSENADERNKEIQRHLMTAADRFIPVVDNEREMHLLFVVRVKDLE